MEVDFRNSIEKISSMDPFLNMINPEHITSFLNIHFNIMMLFI
jgi:hypothetical protein